MADNDDLFGGTSGDTDGTTDSGDAPKAPATQGDGSDASQSNSSAEEKGVAYWMSEAQKAQAALRRAQGLDSKGQPKQDTKADQKPTDASSDATPQPSEFEAYMRESVRRQLFAEEPRLKDFGFALEDISGESLAEMEANRQRLVKVIEKAESRALNQAFEKVGIDPSLAGGPQERKDYAAMSPEEFEKEIQRAKGLT